MKRILVLGSTGTIGINTLDVISRFPQHFEVAGLSAYNNIDLLKEQVRSFKPSCAAVRRDHREDLKAVSGASCPDIYDVENELADLASRDDIDLIVLGISGRAALEPFLAGIRAGKTIAPANKEALVIAGDILMKEAGKSGARIIPVDSEQSAIFQCLDGQRREDVRRIHLTASGGPLRTVPVDRFDRLTVSDILAHPRWEMGRKITVDSATLMNKGFELIEAQRLFGLTVDEIEVVIHPEAIIHSLVSFRDGSALAQLGNPDMRIPIQYALTYPERWESPVCDLDLFELGSLHFERPDLKRFPLFALAVEAARAAGTAPAVLNAANEVAVEAFLEERIPFLSLYKISADVMEQHDCTGGATLEELLAADEWARSRAREMLTALR
ncbi:MAG: 1-deoxy-D-xylulose-5-phosphate reductoisomerase [Candidatus Omnitrophota bacterium]